eukprot:6180143-Pleurochrysis_carterae.AAC.5
MPCIFMQKLGSSTYDFSTLSHERTALCTGSCYSHGHAWLCLKCDFCENLSILRGLGTSQALWDLRAAAVRKPQIVPARRRARQKCELGLSQTCKPLSTTCNPCPV